MSDKSIPRNPLIQGVGVLIPCGSDGFLAFVGADGRYEVPGGHVEPGERPRHAAWREAMEEVGVSVDGLVLVYEGIHTGRNDEAYHAHVYIASRTHIAREVALRTENGGPCVRVSRADLTGEKSRFRDVYTKALMELCVSGELRALRYVLSLELDWMVPS